MIHSFTRLTWGNIIRLYTKKIDGFDNIKHLKTPYIIAANHASFADDLIMPYNICRKTNKRFHIFVNSRFYKFFLIRKFLEHYECIKVDVEKDVQDDEKRKKTNDLAFKLADDYLKKGDLFCIFPEGGRSKDGKLKKAKVGVAMVALKARVPIVPVGIIGSYDILPKGAKFPRFKRARLVIGKPIYLNKFYGKKADYKTLEKITEMVMKEIAKLIGQKYEFKGE